MSTQQENEKNINKIGSPGWIRLFSLIGAAVSGKKSTAEQQINYRDVNSAYQSQHRSDQNEGRGK